MTVTDVTVKSIKLLSIRAYARENRGLRRTIHNSKLFVFCEYRNTGCLPRIRKTETAFSRKNKGDFFKKVACFHKKVGDFFKNKGHFPENNVHSLENKGKYSTTKRQHRYAHTYTRNALRY